MGFGLLVTRALATFLLTATYLFLTMKYFICFV